MKRNISWVTHCKEPLSPFGQTTVRLTYKHTSVRTDMEPTFARNRWSKSHFDANVIERSIDWPFLPDAKWCIPYLTGVHVAMFTLPEKRLCRQRLDPGDTTGARLWWGHHELLSR